jgi:hypothetical protein
MIKLKNILTEASDNILTAIEKANESLNLSPTGIAGNCGVYVIALSRVFPGGNFVLLEPRNESGQIFHVAYEINGKLYDQNGITDVRHMRAFAEGAPCKFVRLKADEEFYRYIEKGTESDCDYETIETALKKSIIKESIRPKNPRLGRCYELSGRYVSVHPNSVLVHGKVINPFVMGLPEVEHAWVEIGDEVFDPVMDMTWPKKVYEDFFHAQPKKKYSHDDVNRITDKTGKWGPWENVT